MNGLKHIFLFLALAVVQLHAAIPHHHHTHALHADCSDDQDLSHPDMGENHLEDLASQTAQRLYMPPTTILLVPAVLVFDNKAPITQQDQALPTKNYRFRHRHRGPPLY
jgi:hypothetical protein